MVTVPVPAEDGIQDGGLVPEEKALSDRRYVEPSVLYPL